MPPVDVETKYTVLQDTFVIRDADTPDAGPQPDGDTVKFQPDDVTSSSTASGSAASCSSPTDRTWSSAPTRTPCAVTS
jgi:hypothetical protein